VNEITHPEMGFHFSVEVDGLSGKGRFQEVSGLEVQVETETIKEGGVTDYDFRIPTRTKYGNITLKRGVFADNSDLADWAQDVAWTPRSAGSLKKRDVTITLLNHDGDPIMIWTVYDAFPTKYAITPLNSMENSIAYETIELCYREFFAYRSN